MALLDVCMNPGLPPELHQGIPDHPSECFLRPSDVRRNQTVRKRNPLLANHRRYKFYLTAAQSRLFFPARLSRGKQPASMRCAVPANIYLYLKKTGNAVHAVAIGARSGMLRSPCKTGRFRDLAKARAPTPRSRPVAFSQRWPSNSRVEEKVISTTKQVALDIIA